MYPSPSVPVPEAVDAFKARQLPPRVREHVTKAADARRVLRLCRTRYTREAREYALSELRASEKVLATVPARQPLTTGMPAGR